tara:strand:+ start:1469 stop:1942 length:474 start_codon:yes stop_codon:yes gene_type:complete
MSYSSDQPLLSNQLTSNIEFDVKKPEFNDILNLQYRRIVDSVNSKEGAFYLLKELANFKQIYTLNNPQKNRNSYRTTLDIINLNGGVIAPAGNANVDHGISNATDSVLIYCSCKNSAGQLFTLVYPDAYITATKAVVNNISASNITQAMFVAEYTKN